MGPPDFAIHYFGLYTQNSIKAGSAEEKLICEAARRNHIEVMLGVSERSGGSLNMGQWHIGSDGQIISPAPRIETDAR